MRNMPPSVLSALPHDIHPIAEYERAFNARRRELGTLVEVVTVQRRAGLLGRMRGALDALVRPKAMLVAPSQVQAELAQPSMAWFDGPRAQPRGGNGRFLSKAWLADAELFLPADRAWFRSPIAEDK